MSEVDVCRLVATHLMNAALKLPALWMTEGELVSLPGITVDGADMASLMYKAGVLPDVNRVRAANYRSDGASWRRRG